MLLKPIGRTAILSYFLAFAVVCVLFSKHTSPLLWQVWGIVEVVLFFTLSSSLSISWNRISPKLFTKKLFGLAFIISALYVIVTYYLYTSLRGEPFEYDPSDADGYHKAAIWYLQTLKTNTSSFWYSWLNSCPLDDRGYVWYLSHLYSVIGDNIFLTRIIKCVYRALMCVFVYKIGARHFGETVRRMAGIFCMLLPNFSFYAASHRKEMEMVFLTIWFLERTDHLLFLKKLSLKNLILPFLLALSLFTFRSVLGVAVVFAFVMALLFGKYSNMTKSIRIGLIAASAAFFVAFSGSAIESQIREIYNAKISGYKGKDLEWRSETNSLASKASAAVFAPMIFVLPFPSMVDVSEQYNQQRLNGAYYIKNILAFFAMLSLILSIIRKSFRKHIIIYTFILSYLAILAFSNFAHSERFHLPTMPILMLLAAHGISLLDKRSYKIFTIYAFIMAGACVAWNAYKLAGRGLL